MRTAAALALFAALASAAPAAAAPQIEGYVVRVESETVYLDAGRQANITPGDGFFLFTEGEALKHPVTGESLGPVIQRLAAGEIVAVEEKYSTGQLTSGAAEFKPGLKFRLDSAAAAAPAPSASASADAETRKPAYRSPILNMAAVDIAVGDVDGDGRADAVLADERTVRVYPILTEAKAWEPVCQFKDDSTGARILSLEAADLDRDGKAEVFATAHNTFFKRLETYVLACKGAALVRDKTLPWMVQAFKTPEGTWEIGAQQLVADRSFPLSSIHKLEFHDGAYRLGERVRYNRVEWLYGFGAARKEGAIVSLFYDRRDRIRLQFDKAKWSSPQEYGQTAERVSWHDNMLQFRPRLLVEGGPDGLAGIHTLRNFAGAYTLAAAFGRYTHSELHHLRWNGLSLEPAWKAEMTGYAAGLSEYSSGRGAQLLVPVRGAEGNTSIWFFDK